MEVTYAAETNIYDIRVAIFRNCNQDRYRKRENVFCLYMHTINQNELYLNGIL